MIALAVAGLVACMPEPAPAPTPSGFSSEAEAFAAAEATYRAYVDAVNARNLDANSEVEPQSFLSGNALTAEVDSQREFERRGITLVGSLRVDSISLDSPTTGLVDGVVCLDVSDTRVLDQDGLDVTPADRDPILGLAVQFKGGPGSALISESTAKDGLCS